MKFYNFSVNYFGGSSDFHLIFWYTNLQYTEYQYYNILITFQFLFRTQFYIFAFPQFERNMNTLLLNTAYFPPVPYISRLNRHSTVLIEQFEHYGKQSYRNRCEILSANGKLSLTVPVKKNGKIKFLTKEAEIDYSTPWQKLHFKGIESAYKNSPFYDYYEEDFRRYFEHREKYLLDLNLNILHTLADLLKLHTRIELTEDYIPEGIPTYTDLRNVIHPKNPGFVPADAKPYPQTFGEKFPFVAGLSILDLLFNMGPESKEYL